MKITVMSIFFLSLTLYGQNFFQLNQSQDNSISKYADYNFTIDGNLIEWNFAEWTSFRPTNPGWKDSALVASYWNNNYLYFAFFVVNKNIQAVRPIRDQLNLHKDDGVEFLIDPEMHRSIEWQDDDICYHINVLNAILDEKGNDAENKFNRSWNGEAITAVKLLGTINNPTDIDTGYFVEIAIPWSEIGKAPYRGLEMGIDYCVNDTDDETGEYRYYDWMKLKRFHYPKGFGTLTLK